MGHSSATTAPSEPEPSHRGLHLPHVHLPGHGNKDTINRTPTYNGQDKTSSNRLKSSNGHGTRPPAPPQRQDSVRTRYMDMLLALDTIPRLHNILASFFTWILLAGFIIFPGTFTALGHVDDSQIANNDAAKYFFQSVKNIPLLVIAGVCCGIGAGGMMWLWWMWRRNYVWLLNRIFLPGCLNSFAGLISTLINVYTQQHGVWNITAEVTAIVAGSVMAITAALFALYNFWVLEKVKRNHSRTMRTERRTDSEGEGDATGLREKLAAPALEPGSVV